MVIAETDLLPLLKPVVDLRKIDDDDDDDDADEYYPSAKEKKQVRDSFLIYLVGVGSAIIAAQQLGLHDAANEGARAAGGGLTASEIADAAESAADFNAEHFSSLKDDAIDALNQLLGSGELESPEDLTDRISNLMDAVASRAERYAKGGGNKAWATALRQAGEENELEGGVWDCNFGPGSCDDCQELHGQWMTWDEFDGTYQQTTCNGGCNCGFHAAANPADIAMEDLAA